MQILLNIIKSQVFFLKKYAFWLFLFKVGLKLNIQKTKIMASSPITSWEIDGETVETVSDFIFLCGREESDMTKHAHTSYFKYYSFIWQIFIKY